MLKKLRENKKGFTLAELLIVVAIIGVLVAVSIPIFTAQLQKARRATNQANARSAKAEAVAEYLQLDATPADSTVFVYNIETGAKDSSTAALTTATVQGTDANDQTKYPGDKVYDKVSVTLDTSGSVTVYGFGD